MKKNIFYVIDSFKIGGREFVVSSLANNINKDCYDVTIIVLNEEKHNSFYDLRENVNIHFVNKSKNNRGGIYFLKTIFKLRSYIKKKKPDIIHTHIFYFDLLIVAFASFGIKIRFFQTIHTSGLYYTNKGIVNYLRLLIEKFAYCIMRNIVLVSISQSVDINIRHNFSNLKCQLIYNGIDIRKFKHLKTKAELRSLYDLPQNKSIIIYLSRIDHGKNHDYIIKQIKNDYENAIFLFVGDGVLSKEIKTLVEKYNIHQKVILWGASNKVEDLLNLSDIAIFPSSFEGFSIVLLELLASQLPVLVSNIAPFREIINDSENGLIFDFESNNFNDKLNMLVNDAKLCEKLKENGFKTVLRFDNSEMVKKHQLMYDSV
jgi:glycosyltransferase involved in cell wall biosynthesis